MWIGRKTGKEEEVMRFDTGDVSSYVVRGQLAPDTVVNFKNGVTQVFKGAELAAELDGVFFKKELRRAA